jgi:hypothetical protein
LGKKGTYNFLREKDEPFLWAKFFNQVAQRRRGLGSLNKVA